ncbi:hypothetical protein Acsp07_31380 [Actinomycetospora sp. NBRC 106378]|nr:hypothetical protein Acsp07_31380 [Actinomycetospora sp. NBRC 106378]
MADTMHHESSDPLPIDIGAFGLGHADITVRGGLCPGGNERPWAPAHPARRGPHRPHPDDHPPLHLRGDRTRFSVMRNKEDGVIKPLITFDS